MACSGLYRDYLPALLAVPVYNAYMVDQRSQAVFLTAAC